MSICQPLTISITGPLTINLTGNLTVIQSGGEGVGGALAALLDYVNAQPDGAVWDMAASLLGWKHLRRAAPGGLSGAS